MSEVKVIDFNGYKVEMRKMRLKDANHLLPFVLSSMTKIGLGNLDIFSDISQETIDLMEHKACEYCYKITEESNPDGSKQILKKNMTLSDMDDCVNEVSTLLSSFMGHNFRFFLEAPKAMKGLIQGD